MSEAEFPEPTWAFVEVMGHRQYMGLVREVSIAGAAMLRVDVPEAGGKPAYTTYLGASAIFTLTPTDEKTARAYMENNYVSRPTILALPTPASSFDPGPPMSDEELQEDTEEEWAP